MTAKNVDYVIANLRTEVGVNKPVTSDRTSATVTTGSEV